MNKSFPEAPTVVNTPDNSVTLASLSYLWQVDNADWVAQREADWLAYVKSIFKDHPKAEIKLLEHYFKLGRMNEYYPESAWFFLTPYDSIETLQKIMNSSLLGPHERGNTISWYLTRFKRFSHCPWYQRYLTIFIEAYLSNGYVIVSEKRETISPPPTYWCRNFVNKSIVAINEHQRWSPFYLCIDYFISTLPFAIELDFRAKMCLVELMHLVDEKLIQSDCEGELLTFLQTLKACEQEIWQAWDIGEQKIAAGIKAPREG